jgi:hypothetical protein
MIAPHLFPPPVRYMKSLKYNIDFLFLLKIFIKN